MITTAPLALYGAATALLEPFAPLVLRGRARRGKEDPGRLPERMGRAGAVRPPGPLVWLHGVSVGETLSLLPLVAALRVRRPDLVILVTSSTITSANLLATRLPPGVIHQFAPVDGPRAVAGFLDHWRPSLGVFVESELWPNLILAAKSRKVRLALLSARMTEASATGWARWPASAKTLLSAFDLILPQDAATEARLRRLGGNAGPRLNLKLTGEPLPLDEALLANLRGGVGSRRVVLCASTHFAEEGFFANAFLDVVQECPDTLLVLAPRHPERGPDVASEVSIDLTVARRGAGEPLRPDTQAYVVDTLGEMGALYAVADVVVMGGSFATGVGGHNPLEAARMRRAVITGPHVFNAADVYADMLARACAIEAADGFALTRHIRGLLDNPAIARRMGEAALSYSGGQDAALDGAMSLLDPLLPA